MAQTKLSMPTFREVLRLKCEPGRSHRQIAAALASATGSSHAEGALDNGPERWGVRRHCDPGAGTTLHGRRGASLPTPIGVGGNLRYQDVAEAC